VLYVADDLVDIQTVELAAGPARAGDETTGAGPPPPPDGSATVVAFDDIEFEGEGVVHVVLRVDDALAADDRAWTIVPSPARTRVLIVSEPGLFFRPFEEALKEAPVDIVRMTPAEYEDAPEKDLADGTRSLFDVVIFDRHDTDRLPQGNYMFWGGVPIVEGVSVEGTVKDELIFNWDETHPILRHIAVEVLTVFEWLRLKLPPEADSLIDGASSPVMAYLTRGASQYLIVAFSLITEQQGRYSLNTYWVTSPDFIVFMHNAVQYLASAIATTGKKSVTPGAPVAIPLPADAERVTVSRPDGRKDQGLPAANQSLHYGRTRLVGAYRVEPGVTANDAFTVNLFSAGESFVRPSRTVTLGAQAVTSQSGSVQTNEPAWPYFLIALLMLLLLEWIVYNRRVFV